MNLSGSEMGILAVLGLIVFGGVFKSKAKNSISKPSMSENSKQNNIAADFQQSNTNYNNAPVKKSAVSKAN